MEGERAPDLSPAAARHARRGRLSSIDTLPEQCDEDIAWANAELRARKMPQTEILREFNARLADRGVKGVSVGAFSRYSIRVAIEMRKMEATRQITDRVLSQLEPGERSDGMIAATEMLKHRILEMVMGEQEPNPKLLNIASLALQRLSATAVREQEGQRRAVDHQQSAEERAAEAEAARKKAESEAKEAAEAVAKIATEAGLTAERVSALRRGVLGLKG